MHDAGSLQLSVCGRICVSGGNPDFQRFEEKETSLEALLSAHDSASSAHLRFPIIPQLGSVKYQYYQSTSISGYTDIMSLQTRVLAGVTIPDTPLITKSLEYTRLHSSDFAFNHIQRSMLFGFIISEKIPELASRDREAHAIAALMHDIGWDPTGELVSEDKRFEVDGAEAARDFLKKEAPGWDKHRLQLVWDAIALHTTGSIVFYKEPEVAACAYGIWADFQGPDRVQGGLLTWDEYNKVVEELPRLELMSNLKDVMLHLCHTKPATTYDNTVGEWGDKFSKTYDRKGKLTSDLLITCDLDGTSLEDDMKK
jgi:hypothetical protein